MKVLGILGSLRERSSNAALLAAAAQFLDSGHELVLASSLGALPHFNPDLDEKALPAEVSRFREEIAAADTVLISTPEYAHGMPGVLKNGLDWLVSDSRFEGKRIAVICGSASNGEYAFHSLLEVLRTMSARVVEGATLSVLGVRSKFSSDGKLVDEATIEGLKKVVEALVASTP